MSPAGNYRTCAFFLTLSYLSPESGALAGLVHITMRLTVMGQYVKGLAAELEGEDKKESVPADGNEPDEGIEASDIAKRLERLKWNMWHGNIRRALQIVDHLEEDLDMDGSPFENGRKLHKAIQEFGTISLSIVPSSKLWRSIPARRSHLNGFRRIDRKSGRQQANGQTAAAEIDSAECLSTADFGILKWPSSGS